jgi:hypothetical protein
MAFLLRPSWTWPVGDHHQLIYSVAGQDDKLAISCLLQWLDKHPINDAAFREQRLLFAASARFGSHIKDHPVFPRLMGLQRLLWSRAQMSISQNLPTVRKLEAAGIPVLFIKGAGMAALPYVSSRQRISHDLDIVVRPADFAPAFEMLCNDDWLPSTGQSFLCLRNQMASLRSINMFKDRFGDIDLHSRPFHFSQGTLEDDDAFWSRARTGRFGAEAVLVASREDALALAIGHGGLDGHTHSDWIIDAARLVTNETIDWPVFTGIVQRRGLNAAAFFALLYLSEGLDLNLPSDLLATFKNSAQSPLRDYISSMTQMRPHDRFYAPAQIFRWVAKSQRKKRDRKHTPAPQEKQQFLAVKFLRSAPSENCEYKFEAAVKTVAEGQSTKVHFELQIEPVTIARRLEFELNNATRHLARFTVRLLRPRTEPFRISISGAIPATGSSNIMIVARPSRQLRENTEAASVAQYCAVAFALINAD